MKQVIMENLHISQMPFTSRRVFNAIIIAASKMGWDIEPLATGLRVSSILPCDENNDILIPVPKMSFLVENYCGKSISYSDRKKINEIHNLPYRIFRKGQQEIVSLCDNAAASNDAKGADVYTTELVQRNFINRQDNSATLFNESKVYCKKATFLYECPKDISGVIESIVSFGGFGANSTTGGRDVKLQIRDFDVFQKAGAYVNVSRSLIAKEDVETLRHPASAYEIEHESGILSGTNMRYPSFAFVKEGAITPQPLTGQLTRIRHADGTLYVYGRAVCLGINVVKGENR